MQKIQKIFKALSMKGSLNVYLLIYAGSKEEYFTRFEDLKNKANIGEHSLRRITNNLSRNKLIKSIKNGIGREKVYIITDLDLAKNIYSLTKRG